jgi:glyoxylase I family protein
VRGLAELKAQLDRAGVTYTMSRSGRRALFCRDPDGNGWEFMEV